MGCHEEILQRGPELDDNLTFNGSDAFCLRKNKTTIIKMQRIGKTDHEVFVIACFRLGFCGAYRARGCCQTWYKRSVLLVFKTGECRNMEKAPIRQAEMILERILTKRWIGGVSTTHYDLWTTTSQLQHPLSHAELTIFLALGQC